MSSDSSGFQTNHQDSLTGFCRICGERARRKYKRQFQNCELFTKETLLKCTDWTLMEMTLISMPQECVTDGIQWWKKSLKTKDVNILDNVSQRVMTDSFWSLHTEQSCNVCTHYVAQDKEGRPAKDRWLKSDSAKPLQLLTHLTVQRPPKNKAH